MADFLTLVGVVVAIVLHIVATIVALIIVVWRELNRQTKKFVQTSDELHKVNNFLKTITLSQIHEKIAVLTDYPTQLPWKSEAIEYKNNRIIADIRSLQQVKQILTDQQKEDLHFIQDKLVYVMTNKGYDVSKIKAAIDVLHSA